MKPNQDKVNDSVNFIRNSVHASPTIGLVLGSGLGDFADSLPNTTSIPTPSIPHYPLLSVEGHKGTLVFATIGTHEVMIFQGRIHFYESDDLDAVLFPIFIAKKMGIRTLIITNAAGGINRSFVPGDLMVISDQLNFTGLHLPVSEMSAIRRSTPYSHTLLEKVIQSGPRNGLLLKKGVYAGMAGPSYETASEVEMAYRAGADAVGMSTVMEVNLASYLGMEVLGISCITNRATGTTSAKLHHDEVTEVARRVKKDFAQLLTSIIVSL